MRPHIVVSVPWRWWRHLRRMHGSRQNRTERISANRLAMATGSWQCGRGPQRPRRRHQTPHSGHRRRAGGYVIGTAAPLDSVRSQLDFVLWSLMTAKVASAAGVVAVDLVAVRTKTAPTRSAYPLGGRPLATVTQRGSPPLVGGGAWSFPSKAGGGRCERGGPGWRRRASGHRPPALDASPPPATG